MVSGQWSPPSGSHPMNPTQALPKNMTKEETPEKITAKSQSNFALSFLFLPKAQREGITNFYALSRVIDDAVDEAPSDEEARANLQFWKQEIALCYKGRPKNPVSLAMQKTIQDFNIPCHYLELLLEGCEWDLTKKRYQDFDELYQYCYRVAGAIGLICMKIFGLEGPEAEKAAEELGLALQLTNILRDIKIDAQMGRIYVPQEDIQRYRLTEADVTSGKMSPKLKVLLKNHAGRAQYYFDLAFTKMKKYPRKPLIAAWIMGRVYYRLLKKIRAKDYDVFSKKIAVSKPAKFWIAFSERLRAF
jgi:15-cis-phytoene synthase